MVYERAREKSDTMRGCFCGVLLSAGRECVTCGSRHLCKRGNHASFFQRGHGKCVGEKEERRLRPFDNIGSRADITWKQRLQATQALPWMT